MSQPKPIAIVGQGIAGTALALALLREGHDDLHLFGPSGAALAGHKDPGVVILPPNATRVLYALGLREALAEHAIAPAHLIEREADSGRIWGEVPLAGLLEARHGAPLLVIPYARLHSLLARQLARADVRTDLRTHLHTDDHRLLATADVTDCFRDFSLVAVATGARPQTPGFADAPVCEPVHGAVVQTTTDTDAPALKQAALTLWFDTQQELWTHSNTDTGGLTLTASRAVQPERLHPSLLERWQSGSQQATRRYAIPISDRWHQRHCVRFGGARGGTDREGAFGVALALEDAWVLSRLIDQHRDDPTQLGHEFEHYRRPRLIQLAHKLEEQRRSRLDGSSATRRLRQILSILGHRFLPEVAYQQRDWLFGYDAVRGFR
ncbi:MAG: hypothetical protein AAF648_06585 [Pseudomonadota bacterium]